MNDYNEIEKIFNLLRETKEDSLDIIKENICKDKPMCLNYINTQYNLFDSGIDFAFQTCITQINNIFMDYKDLKNKTDIKEINKTIINSPNSNFIHIGLSLSYMFYYVKEEIFEGFKIDEINFIKEFKNSLKALNILSIIFVIIIFFFFILFLFNKLNKFTQSMKDSIYRINYSFYSIKYYSLSKNQIRKSSI